jgi:alanine racemase
MNDPDGRWAWAEVDPGAIEHNVAVVRDAAGGASVWAVVKADGYGHGALVAAEAALSGGAEGLCVALVQEGVHLREAGVSAPVLVFGEQPPAELDSAVRHGLTSTVYSLRQVAALDAAAREAGVVHPVHLKVDSGMHRVGCDPDDALVIAEAVGAAPGLRLEGVYSHLAVADEPDHPFTARQVAVFDTVLARLVDAGIHPPLVHLSNSAGALAHAAARRSLVRPGIALYGISPGAGVDHLAAALRPALSLHARVSMVRRVRAGSCISYGLRHTFATDTTVAVLPIGYADGVPRRLFAVGGEVLIGGRRRPIVGVVTMDQLMVDMGDDDVAVGDHAVLIGRQGDDEITAAEWADLLGTIGYEIVCGISQRIERRVARRMVPTAGAVDAPVGD